MRTSESKWKDLYDEIESIAKEFEIAIPDLVLSLPVSTASNGEVLLCAQSVKNYLGSTMGDKHLDDLVILACEGEAAEHLNINEAIDHFAKMRRRRYPLR
ncbi:unnamed protein product [Caretta caretta]